MDDKSTPKKRSELNIKPSKSYLDSLAGFADMLGGLSGSAKTGAPGTAAPKVKKPGGAYDDLLGSIEEAEKIVSELDALSPPPHSLPDAPTDGARAQGDAAQPEETPRENAGKPRAQAELMEELNALVGLAGIKESVVSLINLVKVREMRKENGLSVPPMSLHMVFTGNPGTGKTTVARIMGELFRTIGVLPQGQLVETDRGGLVAGYVGQTAPKTAEVVKNALGGILFIDEAYALAPKSAENDFGREAIETLLKLMEDNRDKLVVIVAGYRDEMKRFIESNPGLESRFNRYFDFPDYDAEELFAIFSGMLGKHEYVLGDGAAEYARERMTAMFAAR
ncbi:MAG: AAA family ATPase, partial [Oscillospiraceae bacterium]|nr:AAA family ATPase [Oscillospiraceae bacterium]